MASSQYHQIKFSDADIVNIEDWIPRDDGYNPHGVIPFLLHDAGFVLCVVFASNLGDAIDIAVDADKLDQYKIDECDQADYVEDGKPWDDSDRISFLGNACEPMDIEGLDYVELPNPPRSFCAQFNEFMQSRDSQKSEKKEKNEK